MRKEKHREKYRYFLFRRTRQEYLDLLKEDLRNYYSYNDFLMMKLIDLFPLDEVNRFL